MLHSNSNKPPVNFSKQFKDISLEASQTADKIGLSKMKNKWYNQKCEKFVIGLKIEYIKHI